MSFLLPEILRGGGVSKRLNLKKGIAWLLAILVSSQLLLIGAQSFSPRTAEAASLAHNLIYKHVYGVRSDGVSFMTNGSYLFSGKTDVVNQYGKVTISEKDGYDIQNSFLLDSEYMNGNIVVCKEGKPYSVVEYGHRYSRNLYYGLINPKTGETVLDVKYKSISSLESACDAKGINTQYSPTVDYHGATGVLPDGRYVYCEPKYDSKYKVLGYSYQDKKNKQIKIAGYALGNTNASSENPYDNGVFRTNLQGKTMYYVTDSKGKIGAVESSGKIVIPFKYDSYCDLKAGSDFILLKKGKKWEYYDLNSVGYGTQSASNTSTNSTGSASGTNIHVTEKWMKSGSRWWYRCSDGSRAKGITSIGNNKYYFDSNGWMKTGWQKISNEWYYFRSDGAMQKGWQKLSGKWYYLDTSSGVMKTGKQIIDKKIYFFTGSGVMRTGWIKDSEGIWYFATSNGAAKTGWLKTGGKWYYFSKDGKMQTGLQTVGKSQYLFSHSGAMQTGWQKRISGKWSYFAKSGAMVKSKWVGDCYLESNGVMATNKWIGNYYVDKNGKWVKGKKRAA